MTRSRQPAAPAPALGLLALTQPRAKVDAQLHLRISLGKELQKRFSFREDMATYKSDVQRWRDYNLTLLQTLFTNQEIMLEYRRAAGPSRGGYTETEVLQTLHEDVDTQIAKLQSIVERLDLYPEAVPTVAAPGESVGSGNRSKVFVVHGHDEGALQAMARFLETIGLQAIILREQPDQGLTIIEKFEACASEVGFAVALLTPDDLGGPVAASEQAVRARQNVIFELGYFAGSLGRGRACLLRKGNVEIPSDLFGVIYTDFDHPAEGWKVKLARELKAAGFKFDADKVLA
jgi:predicted nucleotide-binding protein